MAQSRDEVYHEESSDDEERERSRENKGEKKTKNKERSKRERKRGLRTNQRQAEDQGGSEQDEQSEPTLSKLQEAVFKIREAFISFFSAIDISKGFVFTKKQREDFKREQDAKCRTSHSSSNVKIKWKQMAQWKEEQEKQKIRKLFEKEKLQQIASEQIDQLKEIFLQSSYIFCNETTEELYRLEMQMVKYALSSQNFKEKVNKFMIQLLNRTNGYRFFSFCFTDKLPYKPKQNFLTELINLGEQLTGYFKEYLSN